MICDSGYVSLEHLLLSRHPLPTNFKSIIVSRCRTVAVAPHVRKISHMSQNEWAKSALQEGDTLGQQIFPGEDFEPEVLAHPTLRTKGRFL